MNAQILVIDDSPKIHTLVRAVLAKEPVDVHAAADPRHGLVLAASLRPDLILLDVDMPGLSGFDAARLLRADATIDCPIIFLTAHADPAEKVKGFGLGATDYVTKPFNAAELCVRVRAALKTRGTIRRLEETALVDAVTGLGNRAMFDARLDAETHLHARSGRTLAVLAVEVNGYDALEADYGPAVARQVLKHVGGLVRDACRPGDTICRLDGAAFAAVLPQATAAEARALAVEIRTRIGRLKFQPPTPKASPLAPPPLAITAKTASAVAADPYDRTLLERARGALADATARAA